MRGHFVFGRPLLVAVAVLPAACAGVPARRVVPLPPLPAFAAESLTAEPVAPGLVHRSYWAARGPWAIHVLDVDRAACWSFVARKAGGQAVGRQRTSALVGALGDSLPRVAGGINADFFTFAPPGVPIGPHVSAGRVIAGPGTRPALAFDDRGAPFIGGFTAAGFVIVSGDSFPVSAWNQRRPAGLTLFDRGWGATTDTATGAVEVVVAAGSVTAVDTASAGVSIPEGGAVLLLGSDAPVDARRRLAAIRPGAPVRWTVRLSPFQPVEAVGGFPVLLRDSLVAADLDSVGGRTFGPVRHPRTAVGVAEGGRRILLVTVDGRQPPYSDGMTLRELADLLRQLGARDAINLDGGGSTTMVLRRPDGAVSIVNHPSDKEGERPVANALAVVGGCPP